MRKPAALLAFLAVAGGIACTALLLPCAGRSPSDSPGGATGTHAPPAAAPRTYTFRYDGAESDLPWNRTLWLTLEKDGKAQPPIAAIFFEGEENAVRVQGVPGTKWRADSEAATSRAILRTMWSAGAQGVFGEETTIAVFLPRRAYVRLTGDETTEPGEDLFTVADEEGGGRLVASRRPLQALRLAVWDASQPAAKQDWRTWTTIAPPRPWVFNEVRPAARLVVAAKNAGRQWIAQRVELKPGEELVLDTAGAPPGGGTVVSDDPAAELLLGGDLPIPAVRLVEDFYRAVWTNVPPGKHEVRRAGGKRVEIEVADGAEVRAE
jgi:hypothetical protein